jgi:hypothetical protein
MRLRGAALTKRAPSSAAVTISAPSDLHLHGTLARDTHKTRLTRCVVEIASLVRNSDKRLELVGRLA